LFYFPETFHLVVACGPLSYTDIDFDSSVGLVRSFSGIVDLDYLAFLKVVVDNSMEMVPAWQQP
jgi:hypothetical protein